MFTDAEFERRSRMPRTTYETIRSAVLKTSKFHAVYKQAGSLSFHYSPLPALPAPPAALAVPPAIRGNCCRGRRGRPARSEEGDRATGERGVGGGGSGRRARPKCATFVGYRATMELCSDKFHVDISEVV
jgi:hypothetical protein